MDSGGNNLYELNAPWIRGYIRPLVEIVCRVMIHIPKWAAKDKGYARLLHIFLIIQSRGLSKAIKQLQPQSIRLGDWELEVPMLSDALAKDLTAKGG